MQISHYLIFFSSLTKKLYAYYFLIIIFSHFQKNNHKSVVSESRHSHGKVPSRNKSRHSNQAAGAQHSDSSNGPLKSITYSVDTENLYERAYVLLAWENFAEFKGESWFKTFLKNMVYTYMSNVTVNTYFVYLTNLPILWWFLFYSWDSTILQFTFNFVQYSVVKIRIMSEMILDEILMWFELQNKNVIINLYFGYISNFFVTESRTWFSRTL